MLPSKVKSNEQNLNSRDSESRQQIEKQIVGQDKTYDRKRNVQSMYLCQVKTLGNISVEVLIDRLSLHDASVISKRSQSNQEPTPAWSVTSAEFTTDQNTRF